MNRLVKLCGYGIVTLGLMVVVFVGWLGLLIVRPGHVETLVNPEDLGWGFEEVKLKTDDGVELAGWWIPAENEAQGAVVILHGYPADKANVLGMGVGLHTDFDLLLIDFRYFGESDGWMSTLGLNEMYDLKAGIDFVKEKGYEQIGVYGYSMGGAVALVEGLRNPDVGAVVSQAAYASLADLGKESLGKLGRLSGVVTRLMLGVADLFTEGDIWNATPLSAVKTADKPFLLIHSRDDKTVSFAQTKRLAEVASSKWVQTYFFDGGSHTQIPNEVQLELEDRVYRFFVDNLVAKDQL